jgi:hypothetical protein
MGTLFQEYASLADADAEALAYNRGLTVIVRKTTAKIADKNFLVFTCLHIKNLLVLKWLMVD